MELDPQTFIEAIAPPPVVLVSTLYGQVKNVAPYGMNMPVSYSPPLLALGIAESRDTFHNIVEAEEFVVAYPGPDLIDKIAVTAKPFPRDVSEFDEAGLTPLPSQVVKPYGVKECQLNLECRLAWHKEAGDHYIVVGQVVAARMNDAVYREHVTRALLDPIYHAGSPEGEYARRGPIIT